LLKYAVSAFACVLVTCCLCSCHCSMLATAGGATIAATFLKVSAAKGAAIGASFLGDEDLNPEMNPEMSAEMTPEVSPEVSPGLNTPDDALTLIPEAPRTLAEKIMPTTTSDILSTQWMPRYWYGFHVSVDPETGMQDITSTPEGDTLASMDNIHYKAYLQTLTGAKEAIDTQAPLAQQYLEEQSLVTSPDQPPGFQDPLQPPPPPNPTIYSDVRDNEEYIQAQKAIMAMTSSVESVGWATSLWDSALRFAEENLVCRRKTATPGRRKATAHGSSLPPSALH